MKNAGLENPLSLIGLLENIRDLDPDAPALIHDGETISFHDLFEHSNEFAAGLRQRGIGRESRVAIWLANRPDWLIWLFACARLGAICVAVNTRFRSAEVEDILYRCKVTTLVYEPGFKDINFSDILANVAPEVRAKLELVVTVGDIKEPGSSTISAAEICQPDSQDIRDGKPDDGLLVFTTSGTTSKPKFVLHTQKSIAGHAKDVAHSLGYIAQQTVLLQALPLCGTFGLAQILAGVAGGCKSILLPVFEAKEAIRLIREHGITTFNGPDGIFTQIIDVAKPNDLKTVEWCGFAAFAEAEPVKFVRRFEDLGIKLTGLYGMSETQALFARQNLDDPAQIRSLAGGDLISPIAHAEARDPVTGKPLPVGESGELFLRGPSRFREYLGNDDATKETIGSDGFVRTGDLGYCTQTGGFVFETRMGDSIRLGGFLVNPAEIDAWIEKYHNIAACQSVGVTTDKGLRAVSFVILKNGTLDEAAIKAHCQAGLASFKIPVGIYCLDEFPMSVGPNGEKVQRNKLRELALAELAKI